MTFMVTLGKIHRCEHVAETIQPIERTKFPLSCTWSPSAASQCQETISRWFCHKSSKSKDALGRRFLVFGDSTMSTNHLSKHFINLTIRDDTTMLPNNYHFRTHHGDRCNEQTIMKLAYPENRVWIAPNHTLGEGPLGFGARQPFCSDCGGCNSLFTVCSVSKNYGSITPQSRAISMSNFTPVIYGGYFKVEFARDVEMQTPQYRTSQENIAAFVERAYNKPQLLKDWNGRPVCLISAAHHDAAIPNIAQDVCVSNVRWYIQLMQPQCDFIIWLGANLPAGFAEYAQSPARTTSWNTAVRDMIEAQPDLNTVFVDVLEASHTECKTKAGDNIHMEDSWYEALADVFVQALSTKC